MPSEVFLSALGEAINAYARNVRRAVRDRPLPEAWFYKPGDPVGSALWYGGPREYRWQAIRGQVADRLGCDPHELALADKWWADGEKYAEILYRNGRIVGAFNYSLTPADIEEIEFADEIDALIEGALQQ